MQNRSADYFAGGTLAAKLCSRLRVGVSLFGTYQTQSNTFAYVAGALEGRNVSLVSVQGSKSFGLETLPGRSTIR